MENHMKKLQILTLISLSFTNVMLLPMNSVLGKHQRTEAPSAEIKEQHEQQPLKKQKLTTAETLLQDARSAFTKKEFVLSYGYLEDACSNQYFRSLEEQKAIGEQFYNMGVVYLDGTEVTQDLTVASLCFSKALKYGDSIVRARAHIGRATIARLTKKIDDVADHLLKALKEGRVTQQIKEAIAEEYGKIGEIYYFTDDVCGRNLVAAVVAHRLAVRLGSSQQKARSNLFLAVIASETAVYESMYEHLQAAFTEEGITTETKQFLAFEFCRLRSVELPDNEYARKCWHLIAQYGNSDAQSCAAAHLTQAACTLNTEKLCALAKKQRQAILDLLGKKNV